MDDLQTTPSMVLAAYAERLIEGRRVVVFGNANSGLAQHLVDRGARLVHVYDPDATRVAEATTRSTSRDVSFAPLGQSGVPVRDGAFDVGLVDNLAECLPAADDAATSAGPGLMRRLRRALAARGVALVAVPNPEVPTKMLPTTSANGPTYYELYDLVSAEFDEVRMLGQTPFVGYAVAEFNPEHPDDYSIDTAFVPGGAEEPEHYIALASHFPISADSYSVVQLPAGAVLPNDAEDADDSDGDEAPITSDSLSLSEPPPVTVETGAQRQARLAEDREAELTQRIDESEKRALEAERKAKALEAELSKSRSELARTKKQRADARANQQAGLIEEVQAELAKRDQWVQELENRATTADARADDVQSELEQVRRSLAQSQKELKEARAAQAERTAQPEPTTEDNPKAPDPAQHLVGEVGTLKDRVKQLLEKLEEAQKQIEAGDETNRDISADLGRLESQLRERGAEVARLREELKDTEAFGEQLLRELADARDSHTNGSAPTGELQAQLSNLAKEETRRSADLTAAQWTIRELEAKLRNQAGAGAPELAAELQRAQAEIQRQATLIQQIRDHHPPAQANDQKSG